MFGGGVNVNIPSLDTAPWHWSRTKHLMWWNDNPDSGGWGKWCKGFANGQLTLSLLRLEIVSSCLTRSMWVKKRRQENRTCTEGNGEVSVTIHPPCICLCSFDPSYISPASCMSRARLTKLNLTCLALQRSVQIMKLWWQRGKLKQKVSVPLT
jgi:hypothetical protein